MREAYKQGDADEFVRLFDVKKALTDFVVSDNSNDVSFHDNEIYYKGERLSNEVVDTIKTMFRDGFDINPMMRFLENYMKNPSYNSREAMWKFIEAMGLTITEDGCFLAYKAVDSNYRDKYTHTIDNTPGQKPERMDRSQVDDNPGHHCSKGYHVGALGYAGPGGWYHSYGDKVLICKVNPADVVSVPNDHSCQKLRCCYYEPVGEFQGELRASVYSGEVGDCYGSIVAPSQRFKPQIVSVYDLLEDNYYIGEYTKVDGTTNERYFLVEEVFDEYYVVLLINPEENSGQYRNFKKYRLGNVRTWDGETDPSTLEDPYCDSENYYDYDECCSCCDESLDDCECDEDDDNDDYDHEHTGLNPIYW